MVKHTETIRRQQQTNCLSVFDHFVKLALKGFRLEVHWVFSIKKKNSSKTEIACIDHPADIYLFKVNDRIIKKKWNMFKINNKDTRTMSLTLRLDFRDKNFKSIFDKGFQCQSTFSVY